MLTLIRWFLLKAKQTKCRLAFWQLMETLLAEAVKQPGDAGPQPERGKDT